MICQLTAIYEPQEDGWIVASAAEVPGALSQGRTMKEARANLINALQLLLESYRHDALQSQSLTATCEQLQITIPDLP